MVRVETEPKFKPVKIILETEDEVRSLMELLNDSYLFTKAAGRAAGTSATFVHDLQFTIWEGLRDYLNPRSC
jgi:hypothetical protein